MKKVKAAMSTITRRHFVGGMGALAAAGPAAPVPFARQVLANVTQQGGFPPLMMEPVDFTAIYRQNLQKLAAQQQAGAAPANGGGEPTVN